MNEKDADKLYELTGKSFRDAIRKDNFSDITEKSLFPLGELKETVFERNQNGVFIYKGEIESGPITLAIGLDENDKVSTFFFRPYVAPPKPKDITKIPTNNPLKTDLDKKVDSIARTYISQAGTVGLSIGIAKDGKTYFYGYGEASKDKHEIPDANTIFELGSISKTLTATILATAIGENKLKLDDPVNKYLPDSIPALQFNNKMVTFKDLLNHTSAFPRMPNDFREDKLDEKGTIIYPDAKFFLFLKNLKLAREPGLKHEYSNAGVSLVSIIMQRMYKMSYEDLVNQVIAKPLGMTDTRIDIRQQDSAHFAKGYDEDGSYHFNRNLPAFYQGAGGLRSTASDMLKYASAQWDAPNKKMNKAIQLTRDTTFSDNNVSIGMAWFYVKNGKGKTMYHNGGTGGYRSFLGVNPEKQFAVIVLVNSAVGADKQGFALMRLLNAQ